MSDIKNAASANEPGWLKHARADLGLREKAGAPNEMRVLSYFAEVGRPDVKQDSIAWCAAAHFAWHKRAGIPIPPRDKVLLRAARFFGARSSMRGVSAARRCSRAARRGGRAMSASLSAGMRRISAFSPATRTTA